MKRDIARPGRAAIELNELTSLPALGGKAFTSFEFATTGGDASQAWCGAQLITVRLYARNESPCICMAACLLPSSLTARSPALKEPTQPGQQANGRLIQIRYDIANSPALMMRHSCGGCANGRGNGASSATQSTGDRRRGERAGGRRGQMREVEPAADVFG